MVKLQGSWSTHSCLPAAGICSGGLLPKFLWPSIVNQKLIEVYIVDEHHKSGLVGGNKS